MFPNYQEFMRPFLAIAGAANGNEIKLRDVINQLAEQFNLTNEERTETLPNGRQSIFDNRVGWASTYLKKAGLLETTRRAHVVITPRGINALKANTVTVDDYVDLGSLDFDKLRRAFAKSEQKNAIVFDLKEAIEQKLAQMVKQNPIRLEFYEKYKTIIAEYNAGKDIQAVQKAFDDLCDLMEDDLTPEQERSLRERLDEETLAIYDILKKPSLSAEEEKEVKKVAIETLARLKEEKLKIERWQESTQLKSQVKVMIKNSLYWLPTNAYINDELPNMSLLVYQHVYANYQGAGNSTYGSF